jgi:hypothetical protein
MCLAARIIGFAIGLAIYKLGESGYATKIAALPADAAWLYLSACVLGWVTHFVNFFPMFYKQQLTGMRGNVRANMYIYTTVQEAMTDDDADNNLVLLVEDGPLGAYNRANRSLHHYTENTWPVVVCMLLAGQCFPVPTFVLLLVFALGRVVHQVGYAESGYGGHGAGFGIALLATLALEGLVLVVAVCKFGLL